MNIILVPLDFSAASTSSYRFAVGLAIKTKSKIFALHVIDLPIDQLKEEAIQKFGDLEQKCNPSLVESSLFVELGGIITTIEQMIEEYKPIAVVMGAKGSSGIKEMVLGSNTDKVIRNSPVPVWTIPTDIDLAAIKEIVLPTNLNLDQPDFAIQVLDVQSMFNALLHILYVSTPDDIIDEDEIINKLNEFKLYYGFSNASVSYRTANSEIEGILDFVKETNSQLVIMGTNARKGILHLFKGSITEQVANQLEYPLFTAHLKNKTI